MSRYKNSDILKIEYVKNVFRVKWRLTTWCNYHCYYCRHPKEVTESENWNTEELLLTRAIKINNIIKASNINKPVHLNLIGGEIIFLDLKALVSKIENVAYLNITTNFSKPVEYFEDLFLWCKEQGIKLFINCSHHSENINFVEKFIKLTNWCKSNHFSLPRASIVVTPEMDVEELLQPYRENNITKVVLQKVKDMSDTIHDLSADNQAKLFKSNSNYENTNSKQPKEYIITFKDGTKIEYTSISNFFAELDQDGLVPDNYKCYSGFNGFMVDWNGNIYRTNCVELDDKPLANIDTVDNFTLPTEPYICKNKNIKCCLRNGTSIEKII